MKRFLKTFLLFATSIVFTLALLELIVRAFVPVRNVGPSFTEYDPVYGKSHKKNFNCMRITPEFTMELTTNSLGFRGPEPAEFPRGGILFLGDSFTEGYGVNDGEEYPALVRRELEKRGSTVPVVNCGQGDIGNGRWLKFLRNEGDRYAPRLVFLQVMNNDFFDNLAEDMFVLQENDSLLEYPPAQPGKSRIIQQVIEAVPGLSYSYLVGLLRQTSWVAARGEGMPTSDEDWKKSDRLTYRLVDEILLYCQRKGWNAAVILVGLEGRRLEEMIVTIQARGVPFIVTPQVKDKPELFFVVDQHWNAKGHAYVARQVLERIEHSGIPLR